MKLRARLKQDSISKNLNQFAIINVSLFADAPHRCSEECAARTKIENTTPQSINGTEQLNGSRCCSKPFNYILNGLSTTNLLGIHCIYLCSVICIVINHISIKVTSLSLFVFKISYVLSFGARLLHRWVSTSLSTNAKISHFTRTGYRGEVYLMGRHHPCQLGSRTRSNTINNCTTSNQKIILQLNLKHAFESRRVVYSVGATFDTGKTSCE